MSLTIGDTVLKHGIILAPMAGVTDLPFRLLCREQGCEMSVTEMVSAKAILYGNKNTGELLRTDPREGPVAVQLFGSDPDIMAEIARRLGGSPEVVGCGCYADIDERSAAQLAKDVARLLGDKTVTVTSPESRVRRVYIVSGAGCDDGGYADDVPHRHIERHDEYDVHEEEEIHGEEEERVPDVPHDPSTKGVPRITLVVRVVRHHGRRASSDQRIREKDHGKQHEGKHRGQGREIGESPEPGEDERYVDQVEQH